MKNLIYILLFNTFIINFLYSQDFVSTKPQLRNVVLEEFTGIHCGNCPGGHKKAKELSESNPGRVVLISIHEGSYAIPVSGEPDFRSQWGASILAQTRLSGFPAGTINRLRFPGSDYSFPYNTQMTGGMALGPNGWEPASKDSVLNGAFSPVNIAAKTKWNNDTRELEIDVELYFTEDIPNGAKLNIAFLESHVWGPQTGASDPKHYEHNHILRDLITGQWGELISNSNSQKGNYFKKTFKYTVNNNFNILNSDIAIFVTKTNNAEIFTGIVQEAITPNITTRNLTGRIIKTLSNSNEEIDFEITNISDKDLFISLEIKNSERTPDDWSLSLRNPMDSQIFLLANTTFTLRTRAITINQKGIGDFYIKYSENDPVSNPLYDTITVLTTDINYLEIDAGGTNINSLQIARNDFVSFPYSTYKMISEELNDLDVVIWNCGPKGRLTGEDANLIDSLFNAGIGVLINGSGALPTLTLDDPDNKLFKTFGINWSEQNQIELDNFSLEGIVGDPITDDFNANSLSVANNGYLMQSVNITNHDICYPILLMTDNNKIISVRIYNEELKAVYLGFNLNILTDESLKKLLLKRALDWIEGVQNVDDKQSNNTLQFLLIQNSFSEYPILVIKNPTNITFNSDVSIVDINSRNMGNIDMLEIIQGDNFYFLKNQIFASGNYFIMLRANNQLYTIPFIKFQ